MVEIDDSTVEGIICALLDALKLQCQLTNLRDYTIKELRKTEGNVRNGGDRN